MQKHTQIVSQVLGKSFNKQLVSPCCLNQQQDLEDEAHVLLQQLLPLSGALGRDASTSNGLIEMNFASSLQAAPSPEEAGDTEKEK